MLGSITGSNADRIFSKWKSGCTSKLLILSHQGKSSHG